MSEPAITPAPPSPQAIGVSLPSATTGESSKTPTRFWEMWMGRLFALGEERLFLLLAVLIGIFSGLAVVCFRIAIEFTTFVLLGSSLSPSVLRVLLAPTLAGLGLGLLAMHVFPRSRGSGVNQTKLAVYVLNGYMSFRTVISKFIMCSLAIGSGQSLGPEDPSLQMGAGIASAIGRGLRLSQRKIRMIAPVGAAAGLAAAFNAPISATLFVIEEVIGTWSAGVLGAIVLAAFSSVVTMRWFLGSESLFRVPRFQLVHPWEILAYILLGIVGGLTSLLFLKWIAYARPRIQALPSWTRNFQPAIAGLMIGAIAIKLPQVMGAGYAVIDEALHGQFTWQLLLILGLLKILTTGISFLSGTPGGMFAPSLFIGAMLGGAVGAVEQHLFPHLTGTVATFALIGMCTFFAGFLRVPITSVFMVIELTSSYTAILPAIISTMVAYIISRSYHKVPLFDLLARQDGIFLPSIEERREQVAFTIEDAMRPPAAAIVVAPTDSIAEIARRVSATEKEPEFRADAQGAKVEKIDSASEVPVLCRMKAGEWRLLDRDQIFRLMRRQSEAAAPATPHPQSDNRAALAGRTGSSETRRPASAAAHGQTISSELSDLQPDHAAAPREADQHAPLVAADLDFKGPLPLVFPDESLEEILRWVADWPVVPVVNRADLGKLEGIVALNDILRAFRHAAAE
jgi:chloride channel protein, CIC family